MKTIDDIVRDWEFKCSDFDGRDITRIADYLPNDRLSEIDPRLSLTEEELVERGLKDREVKELTRENVLSDLARDVGFGLKKALDQRGISSELMFYVVNMWVWILDDGGPGAITYNDYGESYFRSVAKYYDIDVSEVS